MSVDEETLRSVWDEIFSEERAPHHPRKPRRAPINNNFNDGTLLWSSSISNMWPELKVTRLLNYTLICGHGV
jgi:hypothetical protein